MSGARHEEPPTASMAGTAARMMGGLRSTSRGRAFGSWLGHVAGGVPVLLLLTAIFALWITPLDYAAQELKNGNQPPGWPHLLGTDQFGRDVLSRVIYGARISLSVIAIATSITVGMTPGAGAGYFGGPFERAFMTVVDLTRSFPDIPIALIFVAIVGPGLTSTTFAIAIAIGYLAQFTRLTRAQIVRLKRETFIKAKINLGAKPHHIPLRHPLPNATAPVIVAGMLVIGDGVVLEATLGVFGPGAQPPTPSWGAMTALDPLRRTGPQMDAVAMPHLRTTRAQARARTVEIFGTLRIPDPVTICGRYPHQLSGGQKQRVSIARALALYPSLLVLDGPTASLDVSVQAQIVSLLEALRADLGLTCLFIGHDPSLVRCFRDEIPVMYFGRVVEALSDTDRPARHPCTRTPMESTFAADPARRRVIAPLEGEVPSPFDLPPGRAFADRCPNADALRRRESPAPDPRGGHPVACHHPIRGPTPFRVLSAEISQETDTFNVRPTDRQAFRDRSLLDGPAAIAARRGANTDLAGLLDMARLHGWDVTHAAPPRALAGASRRRRSRPSSRRSCRWARRGAGTASGCRCTARWSPRTTMTARARSGGGFAG